MSVTGLRLLLLPGLEEVGETLPLGLLHGRVVVVVVVAAAAVVAVIVVGLGPDLARVAGLQPFAQRHDEGGAL